LVVTQPLGHAAQVLAGEEDRQLAAVDDDLLDRAVRVDAVGLEELDEDVDDLVEPAAVGPLGGRRHRDGGDEATEAGGVTAAVDAEHAAADVDDLQRAAPADGPGGDVLPGGLEGRLGRRLRARLAGTRLDDVGGGLLLVLALAHASSPFIWWVGVAASAASSAARATASRLAPRGSCLTWSCSAMIALMSISGRGGQPGR